MRDETLILPLMNELLSHIQDVQKDSIDLSSKSLMMIDSFIENNGLSVDDDAATAFQYQDIISQQLTATIEAIESMKQSIDELSAKEHTNENTDSQSMKKLQEKLVAILDEAKDKKNRFSGKFASNDAQTDEIEFF